MRFIAALLFCAALVSASEFYVEENPVESVVDFAKGFFQALNVKHKFIAVNKCLNDCEPIIKQFLEIWNKIQEFDPTKIMEIVNLVIKAVNDSIAYVKSCAGAVDELNNLVDAFLNIDFMNVITKVLVGYQELLKYINDAINAASTLEAGKAVGNIVFKFLVGDYLLTLPMFNFSDFVSLVEGYFSILVDKKVFEDIDKCLRAFPEIYGEFVRAIQKIMDFDIANPRKIIEGLMELFTAIVHLLNATKSCSAVPEVFEEMIEKFLNVSISEIADRFTKNTFQIIGIITSIVSAITLKNFRQVGECIGKLVSILIYNKPALIPTPK